MVSGCQAIWITEEEPTPIEQVSENIPERIDIHKIASDLPVIFFPSGSTHLSLDARKKIREIAQLFNQPEIVDQIVTIAGHSDTSGDADQNMILSAQRAESVSREFVLNGVKNDRLIIVAMGESHPLVAEKSNDGKIDPPASDQNRRVEIYLGNIELAQE